MIFTSSTFSLRLDINNVKICKNRMGMGVHAAGTAAGWGQGLPGGPQLPPHHATTVTAPPGVQAAPPPPPPPAQMMAYPMQQFQVTITFLYQHDGIHECPCVLPYPCSHRCFQWNSVFHVSTEYCFLIYPKTIVIVMISEYNMPTLVLN